LELGGRRTNQSRCSLDALTNVDLDEAVSGGIFAMDLFYRLNVLHIHLPPLRERPKTWRNLQGVFAKLMRLKHGRKANGISPDALAVFCGIMIFRERRELGKRIERAVIVSRSKRL